MTTRATGRIERVEEPAAPCRRERAAAPCVLVIFGITGDLAGRKLLPALYHLALLDALPQPFAIVGVSRSARDPEALRAKLHEAACRTSRTGGIDEAVWSRFAAHIHCVPGSADDEETYRLLGETLSELESAQPALRNRLYYLAVAPRIFAPILERVRAAGLLHPPGGEPWSRVIIEKPNGRDLTSARELNRLVGEVLAEEQSYRIDHYLGKETVQNLLVFRFANAIFEPLWNRLHVEHVQISAAESLQVSGRGAFYDQTGVVRDVVQNHLLQILALVTMEAPVSLDADAVRDKKVQAIRSLRPLDPQRDVVFGQYAGYREVEGVAPGSRTPTYAAMRVWIDSWRWHGVPFYLRAGKALGARDTEVAVTFRPVPSVLFGARSQLPVNQLVLQIQPGEGISLRFASKVPGEDVTVGAVTMAMTYAEAFEQIPGDAYERLLLDGMRGDATLFARRDEVEEAWAFVDPAIAAWEASEEPIAEYPVGSEGPAAAAELLRADGRTWRPLGE